MTKTRYLLMSALAAAVLAFSAVSAPAFELERVTVTAASVEHSPAAIAVPADLAIMAASEDANRMRVTIGAKKPAVVYFAVYKTTATAVSRTRPFAVPWQV
ncbi:hypothetical protein NKJ10_17720 [Mesorhizobium sp. M0204]|uniref:hypothetical protein n=1 Tax=Mesorhizobium sp. M0204 TaxID=2956913 RepID=UPI003337EABC